MVDWWQPLLYIGVGGVVSLVTAWATNRMTARDSRESEERQARQRSEEEQRRAIREMRRKRMEPVVHFIGLAHQSIAATVTRAAVEQVSIPSELDLAEKKTWGERLEELVREARESAPTAFELRRTYIVAVVAAVSLSDLQEELQKIYNGCVADVLPEDVAPALRASEKLLDRYLSGAELGEEDERVA